MTLPSVRAASRWLLCLAVLLFAGLASAEEPTTAGSEQEQPRRVAVHVVGAIDADRVRLVRDDVRSILPANVELMEKEAFERALARGRVPALGEALTRPGTRAWILRALRAVMVRENLDGLFVVRLKKDAKTNETEAYLLYLRPREDTAPLVDKTIAIDVGDAVDRVAALQEGFEPAIADLSPAAGVEPAPAKPDPEPAPKPAPKPRPATPSPEPEIEPGMALLAIEAGYRVAGRRVRYDDPKTFNLRPMKFFGAHMFAVGVDVFPFVSIPVAEYLGFAASFSRAVALESTAPDGTAFSNTHDNLDAGIRLRFRTAAPPAPIFTVRGGFGWTRYRFQREDNPFFDALPDVWYVFAAGGVEGRLPLGPVAIRAGVDYLGNLSGGSLVSRFSDASLYGLRAHAGFAVDFVSWFEARATAHYVSVFYDIDAATLDPYVAASARDEVLSAEITLVYLYQ